MGVGAILIPLVASVAGKMLGSLWDSVSKAFKGSTAAETSGQSASAGFPAMLQAGLAGRGTMIASAAPGTTGAGGGAGPVVANDAGRTLALGQSTWRAAQDFANPRLVTDVYRGVEAP